MGRLLPALVMGLAAPFTTSVPGTRMIPVIAGARCRDRVGTGRAADRLLPPGIGLIARYA